MYSNKVPASLQQSVLLCISYIAFAAILPPSNNTALFKIQNFKAKKIEQGTVLLIVKYLQHIESFVNNSKVCTSLVAPGYRIQAETIRLIFFW